MTEARRILAELAVAAGNTLPIWRDSAIALLAAVVIGCVWVYVEAIDG